MNICQLSLFLENKPGHLNAICRTLANAGISIRNLALADTQQFGIVRLIVKDVARAREVLEKAGHIVNVHEVVAVGVEDKPGGIANILDVIKSAGSINIEYMYAFTADRTTHQAVLIFRFDDQDAAVKALAAAGYAPLDFDQLF